MGLVHFPDFARDSNWSVGETPTMVCFISGPAMRKRCGIQQKNTQNRFPSDTKINEPTLEDIEINQIFLSCETVASKTSSNFNNPCLLLIYIRSLSISKYRTKVESPNRTAIVKIIYSNFHF